MIKTRNFLKRALVLASIVASGSAFAQPTSRRRPPRPAPPAPSAPAPRPESRPTPSTSSDHDKYSVIDVKVGMPVKRADFVCAKPSGNIGREDTHCVKFLDPRCANKATHIASLGYGEHAPVGCHHNTSNITYLDGTLMKTPNTGDSTDKRPILLPLINIHIIGTRSEPSKVYRIDYTVAPDDLTEDSKLYKTLVGKYGEPTERHGWVKWKGTTTEVKVDCERDSCTISVSDRNFEGNERRRQEEADADAKRQTAPAPKL